MGLGRKLMRMISSFLKLKEIMLLALKNSKTLLDNRIMKLMKNGKLIMMRKVMMKKMKMKMKIMKTKKRTMRRKSTKKSPVLHQLKLVLMIMKIELIERDFKCFAKLHKNNYLLKLLFFFLFFIKWLSIIFCFELKLFKREQSIHASLMKNKD